MFYFLFEKIYLNINEMIFPLARIMFLLITAPLFSERSIPKRVRIGLACCLTFFIYPLLSDTGLRLFSLRGGLALIKECIVGAAIGMVLQFIFVSIRYAGELTGLQMGLSFATFYDYNFGQPASVIARMLNITAILLFLSFDGHLFLLRVLLDSFHQVPIGYEFMAMDMGIMLVSCGKMLFSAGLSLALPAVTLLLCMTLILGILNRLTPQLSVFVVGFPLSMMSGMLILSFMLYLFPPFFENLLHEGFSAVYRVLSRFASTD